MSRKVLIHVRTPNLKIALNRLEVFGALAHRAGWGLGLQSLGVGSPAVEEPQNSTEPPLALLVGRKMAVHVSTNASRSS
jgi:hypothetical protein